MNRQPIFPKNISYPATPPDDRKGVPTMLSLVPAGWPSPAEDYIDAEVDLHKFVVRNQIATFFMHASGESMLGAGIHDGDLLVVDRSVNAYSGAVIIAALDGELTVKRFVVRGNRTFLQPENERFKSVEVTGREDFEVWGVVTYVLHKLHGKTTCAAQAQVPSGAEWSRKR